MLAEILLFLILATLCIFSVAGIIIFRKFYKLIINFLPPSVVSSNSNPASVGENKPFLSSWKYKFALLYSYFNTGYSFSSPLKWFAAVVGVGEVVKDNYFYVVWGMVFYIIFCVIFGYFIYKFNIVTALQEVENQYNLFVKEVRERKTL